MTKSQSSNSKPTGKNQKEGFNRQLPPSTTSTPMPKVKPLEQKEN